MYLTYAQIPSICYGFTSFPTKWEQFREPDFLALALREGSETPCCGLLIISYLMPALHVLWGRDACCIIIPLSSNHWLFAAWILHRGSWPISLPPPALHCLRHSVLLTLRSELHHALVENMVKKEPQLFFHCRSFDQPDMQSLNECRLVFLVYQLKF
jgi:hypothetical protein